MKFIIKDHLITRDIIAKMVVGNLRNHVGKFGQLQVMGGNQTDPVLGHQSLQIRSTPDQPLPVVGASKNFIDEKEQRQRLGGLKSSEQRAQALYFRIKVGGPIRHRVADFDTSEEPENSRAQRLGADGTAGVGQSQVNPNRALERALARHI